MTVNRRGGRNREEGHAKPRESRPPGSTYPAMAARAADAEPGAGGRGSGRAAGTLPMSCLIAAELRLQPRFFPTCTGAAGTSAAAPGSHRQPGGCAPSVAFPRGREGNRGVTMVGSSRCLSGPRGVGIEAAFRGFQRFLGREGPARRMRHIPNWWIRQWCRAVSVPRQDHFVLAH